MYFKYAIVQKKSNNKMTSTIKFITNEILIFYYELVFVFQKILFR